jgi:hypothetical protein
MDQDTYDKRVAAIRQSCIFDDEQVRRIHREDTARANDKYEKLKAGVKRDAVRTNNDYIVIERRARASLKEAGLTNDLQRFEACA